jgi:hypothetical protein
VESISHETVRRVLLANELKPWIKKQWCIPTQADAEFVYHMEDILEVYTRPYDPRYPQVCMDEVNTQLLAETRDPLPMEPGKPRREDYEYERQGVCNVFLACEPLAGQRYTMVAAHRTKQEWAEFVRRLSDECYSDWCWITSTRTRLLRSTRFSRWPRHAACANALRCITASTRSACHTCRPPASLDKIYPL